jgi:subtilisin family serine protease
MYRAAAAALCAASPLPFVVMSTPPPFAVRRPALPRPAALAAWSFCIVLAACGGGSDATTPPAAGNGEGVGGTTPATGPELVLQLQPGGDIQTVAAAAGAAVLGQFGRRPIWRIALPGGRDAAAEAATLQARADVLYAEPNAAQEAPESTRNSFWVIGGDSGGYGSQWAPDALNLGATRAAAGTGEGVRVAVLDTGADLAHPLLADRLARRGDGRLLGRDFVDDDDDPSEEGTRADVGWGHGTHVAGLVALAAPGARLMPVRVLDRQGQGNAWVLAEALAWAVDPDGNPATDDGAHLINLSLGTTQPTRLLSSVVALASCEFDDDDDDDEDYADAGFDEDRARCAAGHGAAVLAAAGNDGSDRVRIYPAAEQVKGARAVAATAEDDTLAAFSNSGGWIKLAAPGEAIVSSVPGGRWGTWSGTSMAAPLATGVAALVLGTPAPSPRPGTTGLRQWRAEDLLARLEGRAAAVCGAAQKQVDALAAVTDGSPTDPACP